MVKRQTTKKEPKMKQKQKQQQNVVVNIGSIAKPRKPRQTKPKQPKPDNKPTAQIHQGILTRGPNTFYQQPQPVPQPIHQPQPQTQTINEIFRLIQQQQRTNIPDAPQIGGTLLSPAPAATAAASIAPLPVVEAPIKAENDLERMRKARIGKFEKPALEKVFTKEPLGQENDAYQRLVPPANLAAVFGLAERKETNSSLLGEVREEPNLFTDPINLHPKQRISEETVKPSLTLEPSELIETPKTKGMGLNFASAFRTLVRENKKNDKLYELAKEEKWPVINITQEDLRRQRLKKLEPLPPKEPFFVSEESPLSLLNVIEQSGENTEPEILQGGEATVDVVEEPPMAFAFPAETEEKYNPITEIKVGEQKQEEEIPPPPIYQGGEFLPAIIQPPVEASTIEQLLIPRVEPSLVEAAAAAAVRQPDISITERLVKGLPAAASEIPEGTPKFRLFMLAQSLNADLSTTGGKKLKTDEIKQRIIDKMGEDYVIPDFKAEAKKPGPKGKATKEAEVVIEP